VLSHIDEGKGRLRRGQGPFDDGLGASNERVDGSVGRLSGINVKKFDAGDVPDGVRNSIDDL
jgi:hypothetical protein